MESLLNKIPLSDKTKVVLKKVLRLLLKIAIIVVCIWLVLTFVFGVHRLSGNNMYPALKDGDLCITYKLEEYHVGDIVAYNIDGELKFGRIIARVGDTIDGDEEGILLNGSYLNEEIFYPTTILDTNIQLPTTLKDNEFVILNDYREDMNDSRTYGIFSKDSLKGKIIFIFRRRGF